MSFEVDVFWSFRSPYSYLATPRLVRIEREWDLAIHFRPVLPIAIRTPEFFDRVNPLWPPYLLRDTARIAEYEGLPYGWPRPDPVVQDVAARRISKDQPHIHRLTRLGVEAAARGCGLAFALEVSGLIFGGSVDGWDQGDHLAEAAARAGLDLAEIDSAIAADPAARDAEIERNQADLEAAGHWGVPTMVFRGEPFFGQDRLDLLLWRMRQKGLQRRA